ncbi:tRNA wybutosine-synthesizing protein [Perkinsela sp. CCAP 1560/4]|nr:tRNA wybutosine-synthesizing protein [Perkinsela sp. CCAP 1560/4]|eukprot:KNH04211.1 tRNA wybutosine-synthesizing protein [Perkinsela sp. CCAP 1560/4]
MDDRKKIDFGKLQKEKEFSERKKAILSSLTNESKDLSKKGTVDERCLPIMEVLNKAVVPKSSQQESAENHCGDFVTTSSCSGRILLWTGGNKSAGKWIFCSHDLVQLPERLSFVEFFENYFAANSSRAQVSREVKELVHSMKSLMASNVVEEDCLTLFKMEPFLMHIQCRTLDAAQILLRTSMECGYRNSGIVIGKKRIVCCIRECGSFQAPVLKGKTCIVSADYVYELLLMGNEALTKNFHRMQCLYQKLKSL